MSESKLNREKYKKALIQYWMEKAEESVESANAEYEAGRLSPAIRSTYYDLLTTTLKADSNKPIY